MQISGCAKPSFGRVLSSSEVPQYQAAVDEALQVLGKDNLGLICFEPSFPSEPSEDTGIGSMLSKGGRAFLDFMKDLGFNHVQEGPLGLTPPPTPSPYNGTAFSLSPLSIDLTQLTGKGAWPALISTQDYEVLVSENQGKDKPLISYQHVRSAYNALLEKAYTRFTDLRTDDSKLSEPECQKLHSLQEKFSAFKSQASSWLEKDALYEVLTAKHGTDDWRKWPDPIDKHLFASEVSEETRASRIQELKTQFPKVFEAYQFVQFVAENQRHEKIALFKNKQVKLISDRHAGFGHRDHWAYQQLFLKNQFLGAPADGHNPAQAWGVPYVEPSLLFEPNGKLGPSGKLLFDIYKRMFQLSPDGLRIDYVAALIHPWVYPAKDSKQGSYLFSAPDKFNDDALRILKHIVLPAAAASGFDPKNLVCEDLPPTSTVQKVLSMLGLKGMRMTQFANPENLQDLYRAKNISNSIAMTGNHDNASLLFWFEHLLSAKQREGHAYQLACDLISADQPDAQAKRLKLQADLVKNPNLFVTAKLAELFASPAKTVQIFFPDLLGESVFYNRPGVFSKKNWSFRVPGNFQETYYQHLSKGKGLNLPEVLSMAIQAKDQAFIRTHQALLSSLQKLSEILKSPSV